MTQVTMIKAVGCVAVALLFGFAAADAQAVAYVDASKAGGNGTSWSQAYRTLETAIAARGNSETFWVARGTYRPPAPLMPKPGSQFYGGFVGTESSLSQRNVAANQTIVDGQLSLRHCFYIISTASGVRIDGFTVIRGRARPGTGWDEYGGGIMIDTKPATIENCTFSNNTATLNGGGVMVNRSASVIKNCKFYNNSAKFGGGMTGYDADINVLNCQFYRNVATTERGGGIWAAYQSPFVSNCLFVGNTAKHGGGVEFAECSVAKVVNSTFQSNSTSLAGGAIAAIYAPVIVENSTFSGNSAADNGGCIWTFFAPATVTDCLFFRNSAKSGGGIQLDSKYNAQLSVIKRCKFIDNTADGGGGFHSYANSFRLESCLFSGNEAIQGGAIVTHGGVGADSNASYSVTLVNCTINGNEASGYGGGMINSYTPNVVLNNCMFWNNSAVTTIWDQNQAAFVTTPDIFNTGTSRLTTRYCDIETLTWNKGSISESHTGSFSNAPIFEDANGADNIAENLDDDFHLRVNSPGIDRGDGAQAPSSDIIGTPRFDMGAVANNGTGNPNYTDVGAYESIQYAGVPEFNPNGGAFTTFVDVALSSTTGAATIRFTTNGSTPTASSPAGNNVRIHRTTTLRAYASAAGYADSAVSSATFTISDQDGDGLADWVETGTGILVSPTNTGTSSSLVDTDGDLVSDYLEVVRGTDPNDDQSRPESIRNDFDGDGQSDFGCYYPPGGNWYFQLSSAGFTTRQFGFTGTLPITGDWDGDAKADFGCYYPPGGNWYRQLSTEGFKTNRFGYTGTLPIVGDWDGDGKDDFGCYYPPGGKWYRQLSTGPLVLNNFGHTGTLPIVGDWDGDGLDDFGCYYPPGGKWYRQLSASGLVLNNFGYTGTLPIVGDWDGDGTDDFGCYYPPGGNWYRQLSSGPLILNNFGFTGTLPLGQ